MGVGLRCRGAIIERHTHAAQHHPILHAATVIAQLFRRIARLAQRGQRAQGLIAPGAIAEHHQIERGAEIEGRPAQRPRAKRDKDIVAERIGRRQRGEGHIDRRRDAALVEPVRQARVDQRPLARGQRPLHEGQKLQLAQGLHPRQRLHRLQTERRALPRHLGEIAAQPRLRIGAARDVIALAIDRELHPGQIDRQAVAFGICRRRTDPKTHGAKPQKPRPARHEHTPTKRP